MEPHSVSCGTCRADRRHRRCRPAFTIVELLVVITIIGVLAGFLLPAIQSARESGRRAACMNNLRQIGTAISHYTENKAGAFPPGSPGPLKHGLFSYILPFLEEENAFDSLDLSGNPLAEPERFHVMPMYLCPSYPHDPVVRDNPQESKNGALTTYQGVGGTLATTRRFVSDVAGDGNMPRNGVFGFGFVHYVNEVRDGLSNTLMMGEFVHSDRDPTSPYSGFPGNVRGWILSADQSDGGKNLSYAFKVMQYQINSRLDRTADKIPFNYLPFGSSHPSGANFLRADGSVLFLDNNTALATLQAAASIDGGDYFVWP